SCCAAGRARDTAFPLPARPAPSSQTAPAPPGFRPPPARRGCRPRAGTPKAPASASRPPARPGAASGPARWSGRWRTPRRTRCLRRARRNPRGPSSGSPARGPRRHGTPRPRSCARKAGSAFDLFDDQPRKRLAVALAPPVVLLRLVLEHQNLAAAAVPGSPRHHRRALHRRPAHLDLAVAAEQQDAVDADLGAGLHRQLLHLDGLAFGDFVLFSARFNDRVGCHGHRTPPSFRCIRRRRPWPGSTIPRILACRKARCQFATSLALAYVRNTRVISTLCRWPTCRP